MAESKDLYGGSIAATLANYDRIRRVYRTMPERARGNDAPVETVSREAGFLEDEPETRRRRPGDAKIIYEAPVGPVHLRTVLSKLPPSVRPTMISVLREHDVPLEFILGRCRATQALMVRYRVFYVLRRVCGVHLKRIGGAFNRHHTSILHAVEQYARFCEFEDYSVFFCSERGGRGE